MLRADLLKPDLVSELVLLGSAALLFAFIVAGLLTAAARA